MYGKTPSLTAEEVKPFKVQILSSQGTQQGEIWVRELTSKQRTTRALKIWGLGWGAALVAVFIPLLHFILVPSLLMAGPIVAFFIYQQQKLIIRGEGTCPKCQKPFSISRGELKTSFNDVCSTCFENVKIQVIAQ